jgi:chromosome segregation ATPase
LLEALLACAAVDDNTSESWVSDDGRYRLGALTGAWNKPEAVYIGHTARAQARERRLHEISLCLQELDAEDALLSQDVAVLETEQEQAKSELRDAPSDDPLRTAVLNAAGAERAVLQARSRLDITDAQCRTAEAELQAERQLLESDAADLKLGNNYLDSPDGGVR